MIRRKCPHGQKYQVIEIPYKGDGNGIVALVTKLELVYNALLYLVSVCKISLSVRLQ